MKAFERLGMRRPLRAITSSPCSRWTSVCACCVLGTLDVTVWPRRNCSLPASHSRGWPGAAVFGYGLVCRWLDSVGPLAGADDGPPSLLGPCGVVTMMKRCQVPLRSPSLSSEEMLRNHSVT